MVTGLLRLLVVAVVAALAALAYRKGEMLLAGGVLGLACIGFLSLRRRGPRRPRASLLHDPSVSTLVFPPESKTAQAVRPPR